MAAYPCNSLYAYPTRRLLPCNEYAAEALPALSTYQNIEFDVMLAWFYHDWFPGLVFGMLKMKSAGYQRV